MTNLQEIAAQIPAYAKDVKINLMNLISPENQVLSAKQIFGSALVCAYVAKEKTLISVFENEAKNFLNEDELNGVKTAAALMAMNNVYYRFTHLVSNHEYAKMPAQLRMQGIATHGIDKVDFEIFSLAASIMNACGACIDAHANQLLKHGLQTIHVQMVAKIAAVLNSLAQVLVIQK